MNRAIIEEYGIILQVCGIRIDRHGGHHYCFCFYVVQLIDSVIYSKSIFCFTKYYFLYFHRTEQTACNKYKKYMNFFNRWPATNLILHTNQQYTQITLLSSHTLICSKLISFSEMLICGMFKVCQPFCRSRSIPFKWDYIKIKMEHVVSSFEW